MLIFLLLSVFLFLIGFFGMFLVRRHILIILISLELILLASTLNFVIFSTFHDDFMGQIYGLLVLTIAASETALGLAVLIVYYRLRGGIAIDLLNLLKS